MSSGEYPQEPVQGEGTHETEEVPEPEYAPGEEPAEDSQASGEERAPEQADAAEESSPAQEESEEQQEASEEQEAPVDADGEYPQEDADGEEFHDEEHAEGQAEEEEQDAAEYEQPAEASGEVETYYDGKVHVREEVARIDECCRVMFRGLSALVRQGEDVDVNVFELFEDFQREEDKLFSPIPDYVARELDSEKNRNAAYNRNIQPHSECRQSTSSVSSRFSDERRAFVDPNVPLQLPYSLERFKRAHPERAEKPGTYHGLFSGEPDKVQFNPPENNKRKQIEEAKKAHPAPAHGPAPKYDPPRKKPMKVGKDFVPACANVTTASAKNRKEEAATGRK